MINFEYIFMDKDNFDKNGIDDSKFKKIEAISSFQVVKYGVTTYCYLEYNFNHINPFLVKEIEIPLGKVMIIGRLDE